jgi:transposase
MDERLEGVAFPPTATGATAEGQMIRADLVREMVARRERGEGTRPIARELAVDRKTVRRWLRLGGWQPRQGGARPRALDPYLPFIERRGPEVNWNGVVLYRELVGLGFSGGYQQVQRLLKPRRDRRHWEEVATVRFETAPGEQAQVDYGQLPVWIGEQRETVQLFVFTLGYSRRLFTRGYRNERLATLLDGHERAFRHFGGVTLTCLYDNPRTLVLGRRENKVLWHPLFEDFARYYGFTPRACQPYRARTKGKVESGVK